MAVRITAVQPDSPAARAGIGAGDRLESINGREIVDVLDYRFFVPDEKLRLTVLTAAGRRRHVRIRKEEYEDIGLEFDTYLMDPPHACRNGCIFCFIDQLPAGMRDTLYFKDDDSRLSFLLGNYITLTNLTDREIDRIEEMHISPVKVSVHTTDPELRCRMMHNRFAGERLQLLERFAAAGIELHCQLVLCPGWNDGEALERSLRDLARLAPAVRSVAAVPVGLTRHREGLDPLRGFPPAEAARVLDTVEAWGARMRAAHGERIFYAADEFYLLADRPLPPVEDYGDFLQLENGVGMLALFEDEFRRALEDEERTPPARHTVIATGTAAAPFIRRLTDTVTARWRQVSAEVIPVVNRFFGESITVAGLVTGGDLIEQVRAARADAARPADALLIPRTMLRAEGDRFLDDVTPDEVSAAVGLPVQTVADGAELLDALTGLAPE